jgi:hypothetical protein
MAMRELSSLPQSSATDCWVRPVRPQGTRRNANTDASNKDATNKDATNKDATNKDVVRL